MDIDVCTKSFEIIIDEGIGPQGMTPRLRIGTVETAEPGEPASASITGTNEEPVLNLVLPRGDGSALDLSDRIAKGTGNGAVIQGQIDGSSKNIASGNLSFAQGVGNTASGHASHSEGSGTTATGPNSHAEGGGTAASGDTAHAEGGQTVASGNASHAEGGGTIAARLCQHVFGQYNVAESGSAVQRGTYVEIVGNGTAANSRSNARTLDWEGNEALAGGLMLGMGTEDEVTISAAQLKALLAMLT